MTKEEVKKALDEVRPALQRDGGDIELVSVDDGIVKVKFLGGCAGCPFRSMTLSEGIEKHLKNQLPEVKKVVAV